jgi:hypothetical protein
MATGARGPRARARRHDWIDERSRALHEAVAERLRDDPQLVSRALVRLDDWERWAEPQALPAIREWRQLLSAASLSELLALLVEDSEKANRLRQSSPFVDVLPQDERLAIFRRFETL